MTAVPSPYARRPTISRATLRAIGEFFVMLLGIALFFAVSIGIGAFAGVAMGL